jgi:DNA-binding FrmR family transcriptional regulator
VLKMATKKIAHVLSDEEQVLAIAKRIKRAQGQLGAVVRMLEEGRNCEEIVTQMSAVSKAVNTAAFNLISASLKECIIEDKNNSDAVSAQLQKLFLSLA